MEGLGTLTSGGSAGTGEDPRGPQDLNSAPSPFFQTVASQNLAGKGLAKHSILPQWLALGDPVDKEAGLPAHGKGSRVHLTQPRDSGQQEALTTIARRLLSVGISARRMAAAEGWQDKASALSHLEDSQRGPSPQLRNPGPGSELACWLPPLLNLSMPCHDPVSHRGHSPAGLASTKLPPGLSEKVGGRGLSFWHTCWPAMGAPTCPDLCTSHFPQEITSWGLCLATSHWPR